MKYIINYLSIIAGRKFAMHYHEDHLSSKADGWKNLYIGLRRMLPIVKDQGPGGPVHWGNHKGSNSKPYYATQTPFWLSPSDPDDAGDDLPGAYRNEIV